jgi:HK97 family phage major capsid protein
MEPLERIEKAIGDATTKIGADLGAHKSSLDALGARLDKIEAKGNRLGEGGDGAAPTMIETAITKAPGFLALKSGATSSGRIAVPGSLRMIRKAIFSSQSPGSPSSGFAVLPERYDGVGQDPRRKLTLLEALPHLTVHSNLFEWAQLDGYIDAAAEQGGEGVVKAEAQVPFRMEAAKIATIAHFAKASKQILDDVPMLRNYVQGLLSYGVSLKLERLIVAGNTPGSIVGLLPSATPFVPTALKAADQISEAQAHLAGEGWTAALVILNPVDWHKIRTERSTTAYFAGTWNEPASPNIWSLPIVTTPSCTAGTAIVMSPDAVAILDREDVHVMFGYDGNDFTANLMTVLAEGRYGFAVISSGAILSVALTF